MKARTNRRKHGVSFEDAMHIFDDPHALFEQDRIDETGGCGGRPSGSLEVWFCRWWRTPFERKAPTSESASSRRGGLPGRNEIVMTKLVR